jgi:hypothetical protein
MDYSLVDELKQDLHNEKLETLWKKYHRFIYVLIALILLGTSGGVFYKQHKRSIAQEAGNAFFMAVYNNEQGKKKEAIAVLDELVNNTTSFAGAAAILRADIQQELGEDPIPGLEAALKQGKLDPVMKEVVGLQKARYAVGKGGVITTNDFPLLNYSAKELALVEALTKGDKQEADKQADALLNDAALPPLMRTRIQELKASRMN